MIPHDTLLIKDNSADQIKPHHNTLLFVHGVPTKILKQILTPNIKSLSLGFVPDDEIYELTCFLKLHPVEHLSVHIEPPATTKTLVSLLELPTHSLHVGCSRYKSKPFPIDPTVYDALSKSKNIKEFGITCCPLDNLDLFAQAIAANHTLTSLSYLSYDYNTHKTEDICSLVAAIKTHPTIKEFTVRDGDSISPYMVRLIRENRLHKIRAHINFSRIYAKIDKIQAALQYNTPFMLSNRTRSTMLFLSQA